MSVIVLRAPHPLWLLGTTHLRIRACYVRGLSSCIRCRRTSMKLEVTRPLTRSPATSQSDKGRRPSGNTTLIPQARYHRRHLHLHLHLHLRRYTRSSITLTLDRSHLPDPWPTTPRNSLRTDLLAQMLSQTLRHRRSRGLQQSLLFLFYPQTHQTA